MKKLIYLFMALALVVTTACDPMEDIYEVLDAQEEVISGDAVYVVTDEDYEELGLTYGSFNSIDEVKTMLPPILTAEYPVWGKGSSALTEFNLYIGSAFNIDDYTLTEDDYSSAGSDLLGFESDQDPSEFLPQILADNVSNPDEGDYAISKYSQYSENTYVVSPMVSFEENFDYGTVAGDLTTTTSNWVKHSGSSPVGYATTSLSMSEYPNSGVGGSMTFNPSNSEDVNSGFTTISSGKVYASALVNFSAVGSGNYFFHIMEAPDTQPYAQFRSRVGAKDNGSGKVLFGIGASSSSLTYGSTAFDLNTTYLLVSSYEIATGVSNLYVLSSAEDSEPSTPEATNTGNSGNAISAVAVRQSSNIPTGTIDGIRVANTWSAIMSNDMLEDEIIGEKTGYEASYTYSEGAWEVTSDDFYTLTTADYDSMGEGSGQPGKYNNFSSSINPNDYIPNFLNLKFPYALEEDVIDVAYKYYSGDVQLRGNRFTFTNGVWVSHLSVIESTLQFGHDGVTWVPDNTIKYTLNTADYALTDDDNYGNYYVKGMSEEDALNDEVIPNLNIVLKNNFPSSEVGQKYTCTYNIYNGSSGIWTTTVILDASGDYVLYE